MHDTPQPRCTQVCNEILDSSSNTTSWDDIAGLGPAKKLVQEIIVWPMLNPQLFKVCVCVWRKGAGGTC